jgi:UDP-N-acetyl-D-mannosaminuronic acid dehydrogenase
VNDGKADHVIARAAAMIAENPTLKVGCMGLAFKANIDDFRESPAMKVAVDLASRFGARIKIVEPYAANLPREFDGSGAQLIDLDTALLECGMLITLVDHDAFKAIPLAERAGKIVYDVRGIWPDQPRGMRRATDGLRLAG